MYRRSSRKQMKMIARGERGMEIINEKKNAA